MLLTTLYFLLALFILVVVHEFGHFQVARWCGVKVLRFSFGFGKILTRWQDKKGTQYVWSLFPLGGYVKMLGESTEPVRDSEKHMAFNRQPIWVRTAIVLAGPLFNFIFAFIALWLVSVIGINSLAPMIKTVKPGSIADKAGMVANQELVGLNDINIHSWKGFQYAIMPYIGSEATITLRLKSLQDGKHSQISLPLADWTFKAPDPLGSLGIEPFIPKIAPVVGGIIPNSPAGLFGIQVNDKILSVDGKSIDDWIIFANYIKSNPDKTVKVTLNSQGQVKTMMLKIGHQKSQGKITGFLGLQSKQMNLPAGWLRLEREGPVQAIKTAFKQTFELTSATFILMGRLITGKLSLKSISGPLGIAEGAGLSGRNGLVSYLFFLALISISLGAINLLPIPMLDGGHLLYYAVEIIRGKPLPDTIKNLGIYFGFVLLATLMFVAFMNDITRFIEK